MHSIISQKICLLTSSYDLKYLQGNVDSRLILKYKHAHMLHLINVNHFRSWIIQSALLSLMQIAIQPSAHLCLNSSNCGNDY